MLPLLAELSRSRGERRSLAELARGSGRSTSHFQRAFSRLVHESPKQFTLRLQLEVAAVMLLTADASVLDVALEAGFDSHEGFTRAFKGHFGVSPKMFRRQRNDLADAVRQAHLIEHVGPCLRLFRTTSSHTTEISMSYDITRQSIEATTLLFKSARCPHEGIAEALGRILPAIFQHATEKGIQMVGPPVTIYDEWGPGMVALRGGIPVAPGTTGEGDIEHAALPATDADVTIHTGAYDGLGDAHAALDQYLHAHGLKKNGSAREIYLTDPGEVPNPDDWKTRVIWPVK
jgi:AraC family transcriptional regulator